jgi:hypothetical protein
MNSVICLAVALLAASGFATAQVRQSSTGGYLPPNSSVPASSTASSPARTNTDNPTTPRTDNTAAQAPEMPKEPGFYFLDAHTFQPMQLAPIQSIQPKIGRAILNTYSLGLAGNRTVIQIPGQHAPVHLGHRPTFLLITVPFGPVNPRALTIVNLDKKKKHREVNIEHGTSWNPSFGLSDPKWPFTITQISGTTFELATEAEVPDGEYLVVSSMMPTGTNGYDFTIATK